MPTKRSSGDGDDATQMIKWLQLLICLIFYAGKRFDR